MALGSNGLVIRRDVVYLTYLPTIMCGVVVVLAPYGHGPGPVRGHVMPCVTSSSVPIAAKVE